LGASGAVDQGAPRAVSGAIGAVAAPCEDRGKDNREDTMVQMTRRDLGLGAAAFGLLPTLAAAQGAAPAPTQAPGFHRFKVGGFTVTVVNDGFARRNVEGLVLNAPVEEVRAVLAESFLPTDHYIGPYNVTFVDTGRMLVMFDAGTGAQMAPTAGRLAANMQAAGIDPARVGLIVITHCHQDHIHGRPRPTARPCSPTPRSRWPSPNTPGGPMLPMRRAARKGSA
jgi:hypothetical protein